MKKEIPEIAEIVRHWMPNADDEELKEAQKIQERIAVIFEMH